MMPDYEKNVTEPILLTEISIKSEESGKCF